MSVIQEKTSQVLVFIHGVLQGTNALLAISTNAASLLVMIRSSLVRETHMMLLTSLALAGLLVGVTAPVHFYEDFMVGPNDVCTGLVLDVVADIPLYHQMLHTLLIAVDRFVAVTFPLHHPRILSPGRLKGLLIVTWLSPAIRFGSLAYLETCVTSSTDHTANVTNATSEKKHNTSYPNGVHFVEGACYVVIVVAMVVLYGKIWSIAWRQHKRIASTDDSSQRPYNVKATRTLSCILLVYVLTWMPVFVLTLVSMSGSGIDDVIYVLVPFAFELGLANSWVNFFVYVRTNGDFSRECRKYVCW